MDNKFCTKCGFELPITAKFCERCGNSITNSKDEFIPQSKTTKKKSGNALQNIIIIGGVLFVFIILIGLGIIDTSSITSSIDTSSSSSSSISKSYYKVKTILGKGGTDTQSFNLSGGNVKMISTVKADVNDRTRTGQLSVRLRSVIDNGTICQFQQTYPEDNPSIKDTKTSYCYNVPKGQYYLMTIGNGSDWSIEVHEER